MVIKNRFVRSATWEGLATEEGGSTPKLDKMMVDLANGETGLIITGHTYVMENGQAGPWQLGIYKDELVSGLKSMTDAVHENGGKIIMQLSHAGIYAKESPKDFVSFAPSEDKEKTVSPHKKMTQEDIAEVVNAFTKGAQRAKEAGFDGIQLHAAHGYLLSQFLSPLYNHREDYYGGNIRNRSRIIVETLRSIRKQVGKDFPLMIKINSQDAYKNGLTIKDSINATKLFADEGLDAVEISGGLPLSVRMGPSRFAIKTEEEEAYFKKEAKAFKENLKIPIILVGGIRSYNIAEEIINKSIADYISMSRPFIKEPDLIRRWIHGDIRKADCLSDNRCYKEGKSGEGISCPMKTNTQ